MSVSGCTGSANKHWDTGTQLHAAEVRAARDERHDGLMLYLLPVDWVGRLEGIIVQERARGEKDDIVKYTNWCTI